MTVYPVAGSGPDRARRLVVGIAALAALAILLGGVPWTLLHYVGWPLPHALPAPGDLRARLTDRPIPQQALLDTLACVVWAGWAVLGLTVSTECIAAIRGRGSAGRIHAPGPFQLLAGSLVGAVVLAAFAVLPRAAPVGHVPLTDALSKRPSVTAVADRMATQSLELGIRGSARGAVATVDVIDLADVHPEQATESVTDRSTDRIYVVGRRDTLWGIAQRELGDPERWKDIARLNYDQPQPDGRTLTDAHWIYPGWRLRLPEQAPATPNSVSDLPKTEAHPHPSTGASRSSSSASPPPSTAPTARPVPPGTSTRPAPVAPTARLAPPTRPAHAARRTITLPSGSEVGAALAAGVLAATATVTMRRRRRYRPAPPAPADTASGSALAPALRALLAASQPDADAPDTEAAEGITSTSGGGDATRSPDEANALHPAASPARLPAGWFEVGTRGHERITFTVTDWAGLAVSGDAADSVLRAWLTSVIASAGSYDTEIVASAALLQQLLPGVAARAPSLLREMPDDDAVLSELEVEQIRRHRLLADAGVDSIADLRRAHPEDPIPVAVAVLDTIDPGRAARWELLRAAASRLGLGLLVRQSSDAQLAEQPTIGTDAARIVVSAEPSSLHAHVAGARLFAVGATEAAEILEPVIVALQEPGLETPAPNTGGSARIKADHLLPPVATPPPMAEAAPPTASLSYQTDRGPVAVATPVRVQLFGPPTLHAWDRPVDSGLRESARELLAWYALHPDGATAAAAIDAIWPDAAPDRGPQRFWNALGNLRSRLRGPEQQRPDVLTKVGDRYRPEANTLDIDVWRIQVALAAAQNPDRAREELTTVVDLYRGDFVAGTDYLWAVPVREDFHRRALDAHVRLAQLHETDGRPDAAAAILERAITLDPVAEDIYRRLMRLLARQHRADAADRVWARLQGCLADIDVDPDPATIALLSAIRGSSVRPQLNVGDRECIAQSGPETA